ncbi:DUF1433 domain-containing protein [Macrococcus armenti]|uniref:DUF1433 domain-containing protein n=1 Tax=Macrococcus armenti TaxID=2875764 RepID=UPI001CC9C0B5|nr:DUF1433 domain-containing protein [Macrococcus armenti]UBH08205.1 DUF1433 domain-containing protein [Macrococcus armenti]UBH10436.1 DUF1433 domain-containing protein [Macrococcus armenti]
MKKLIIIIIVILTAIAIYSGLQYKAQKDVEQEKIAEKREEFYKSQQERIKLYFIYNAKDRSKIKSIHFTNIEDGAMGDVVIEGYINHPDNQFTTFGAPQDNFQFDGNMVTSNEITALLKESDQLTPPNEIYKKLSQKEIDALLRGK